MRLSSGQARKDSRKSGSWLRGGTMGVATRCGLLVAGRVCSRTRSAGWRQEHPKQWGRGVEGRRLARGSKASGGPRELTRGWALLQEMTARDGQLKFCSMPRSSGKWVNRLWGLFVLLFVAGSDFFGGRREGMEEGERSGRGGWMFARGPRRMCSGQRQQL